MFHSGVYGRGSEIFHKASNECHDVCLLMFVMVRTENFPNPIQAKTVAACLGKLAKFKKDMNDGLQVVSRFTYLVAFTRLVFVCCSGTARNII